MDLLRWYVRETYDVEDEKLLLLLKSYLTAKEGWDLKWHVTLVTGKQAVICTRGINSLDKIYLIHPDGGACLFLKQAPLKAGSGGRKEEDSLDSRS